MRALLIAILCTFGAAHADVIDTYSSVRNPDQEQAILQWNTTTNEATLFFDSNSCAYNVWGEPTHCTEMAPLALEGRMIRREQTSRDSDSLVFATRWELVLEGESSDYADGKRVFLTSVTRGTTNVTRIVVTYGDQVLSVFGVSKTASRRTGGE